MEWTDKDRKFVQDWMQKHAFVEGTQAVVFLSDEFRFAEPQDDKWLVAKSPPAPPASPALDYDSFGAKRGRLAFPYRQPRCEVADSTVCKNCFLPSSRVDEERKNEAGDCDCLCHTRTTRIKRKRIKRKTSTIRSFYDGTAPASASDVVTGNDIRNIANKLQPYRIMETDTHVVMFCNPPNSGLANFKQEKETYSNCSLKRSSPESASSGSGVLSSVVNWIFKG